MRASFALLGVLSTVTFATTVQGYCPSYPKASVASGRPCATDPQPGNNPSLDEWRKIFAKVAQGPAAWTNGSPTLPLLREGCGSPTSPGWVTPHFPCGLLKALAMQESGWRQFCVPDAPASERGAAERTIVSFDCGYGVGQVTSGMREGDTPNFDRRRVATDALYNLQVSAGILRDKWGATSCVGDRRPATVEHWYTALWAYNGLSYANNPNNPNLQAGRAPYNPRRGGAYAYQEKVLGWLEYPASPLHAPVVMPAYPDRGLVGSGARPSALPEPTCAGPTNCATTRPLHTASCAEPAEPGAQVDPPRPPSGDESTGPSPQASGDRSDAPPATENGSPSGVPSDGSNAAGPTPEASSSPGSRADLPTRSMDEPAHASNGTNISPNAARSASDDASDNASQDAIQTPPPDGTGCACRAGIGTGIGTRPRGPSAPRNHGSERRVVVASAMAAMVAMVARRRRR